MRKFHNVLFLGAGDTTVTDVQELHALVDRALDLQSGMQQSDRVLPDQMHKWDQEIEDVVRDVAAALTGRSIKFGRLLPRWWMRKDSWYRQMKEKTHKRAKAAEREAMRDAPRCSACGKPHWDGYATRGVSRNYHLCDICGSQCDALVRDHSNTHKCTDAGYKDSNQLTDRFVKNAERRRQHARARKTQHSPSQAAVRCCPE